MQRIEQSLGVFSYAFFGVTMVLIIILTATTPMACGVYVHLPWASTAAIVDEDQRDLLIWIKRDRSVFVGMNYVAPDAIESTLLQSAQATGKDRHILIRADGAVPYSSVEQVLRATRTAGFNRVSLVTFRGTLFNAWQRGGAV
jgi:biopolymer transport protein TolR